jgi:hypothetical protein
LGTDDALQSTTTTASKAVALERPAAAVLTSARTATVR